MKNVFKFILPVFLTVQMTAQTVWDVIVNSPNHTTLETAVLLAGLDGALDGPGPLTVFAPDDAAFEALPAEVLNAALADPSGLLTNVLLYHVVGAQALSTSLSDGQEIPTLFGQNVVVDINGGVFINSSQVTAPDILGTNGVVHVIDAVLLPTFPEPTTVLDIIIDSPDHTLLETAIFSANLEGTLSGDGPFTVFAPTDAAFNNLPEEVLDAVLNDPDGLLTQVLLYHVVAAEAFSTDLSDAQAITTVLGQDIIVTINMDGVFINDAQVTAANIEADNGVVHVIDAILIPDFPEPVTMWDIIVDSPDHATLETAVLLAGLDGALSGDGPLTVFAPTDDAFAALPADVLAAVLADPTGQLTDILLYHVVAAEALSTDLSNGQNIITLNGQEVTVSIMSGNVFINNAQVTVADIETDNGVVHVIDAVLLPAPPPAATVWEIIVNSPDHTILETAVGLAGLTGALEGDGPLTVFAPTDAAFGLIPTDVLNEILADPTGALTNILLYHVVGAQALSTDLSDGQSIATLQGQSVSVNISGGMVMINNANVIAADLLAENGVVHVIDAVLIPTTNVEQVESLSNSLFPNPAVSVLNINLSIEPEGAMFEIFNLQGQKVNDGRLNGLNNAINLDGLASGTYALRLVGGNVVGSYLFVKE